MTRRATVAATATGLAVLTLLAGARWTFSTDVIPAAHWRAPVAAGTPPATATVAPTTMPPGTITPSASSATPTNSSAPTPTHSAPPPTKPPTKPPSGPLDLRRTTGTGAVALTFDDGPHPTFTPQILERLRAARVHATFCLVGTQVKRHPELVARIVHEGHTLCNHTWHHEFELGTLSKSEIRANLERTNRAIHEAAPGAKITFFRHPGGMWTPDAVEVAHDLGMVSLHWSVDPQDWARPGATVISQRVIDKARSGSIILLHDGGGDRAGTVEACKTILPALKEKYGVVLLK